MSDDQVLSFIEGILAGYGMMSIILDLRKNPTPWAKKPTVKQPNQPMDRTTDEA